MEMTQPSSWHTWRHFKKLQLQRLPLLPSGSGTELKRWVADHGQSSVCMKGLQGEKGKKLSPGCGEPWGFILWSILGDAQGASEKAQRDIQH